MMQSTIFGGEVVRFGLIFGADKVTRLEIKVGRREFDNDLAYN